MGGLTQTDIKKRRNPDYMDLSAEVQNEQPRVTDSASAVSYMKDKREEIRLAEEAERDRVSQELEAVRQQREVSAQEHAQAQQQHEAAVQARENQQRALEQTGAVDGRGGTNKPYNPTSSASATVEGLGGERDRRRKRNQLTAYLGI